MPLVTTSLRYFAPVATDARLSARAGAHAAGTAARRAVERRDSQRLPLAGPDLAELLERFEECFAAAATVDRADLFRTAARLIREAADSAARVLLLDVRSIIRPSASSWRRSSPAPTPCWRTVPAATANVAQALAAMGGTRRMRPTRERRRPAPVSAEFLFNTTRSRQSARSTARSSFSLRRAKAASAWRSRAAILAQARGRRALRRDGDPRPLAAAATSVCSSTRSRRADVPAWFDRGTRRPHPAGRAFLALLACAAEQLSAARFAEYLSLGQVPRLDDRTRLHRVGRVA